MTDVFDRAQEREEEMRADALMEHVRHHPQPSGESSLVCECGEPIPEARRRAIPGVRTCIECQRDIERRTHCDWGMAE